MRLSEAILLGSATLTATPYRVMDGDGGGCALGMGFCAVGARTEWEAVAMSRKGQWIWLKEPFTDSVPCGCPDDNAWLGMARAIGKYDHRAVLAHIFNEHVCGDNTWTLEQLVDWVRSVEPAESVETHAGKIIDESIAMVEKAEKQAITK
jgi:hypothetical protein